MSEKPSPTDTEIVAISGNQAPGAYLQNAAHYGETPPGAAATPAQAFVEHVADVRKCGDALDFIPYYAQRHAVGFNTFAISSVFTVTAIEATSANNDGLAFGEVIGPGIAGLVSLGLAAYIARKRYTPRVKLAEEAWNLDIQRRVGENYDLFRIQTGTDRSTGEPQYEVHMRYYGPADSRQHKDGSRYTTADYVKDVAALAESAGVDKLMMGSNIARFLDVPEKEARLMKKIIEDAKPIRFNQQVLDEEKVVVREPSGWRQVENANWPNYKQNEIFGLVQALKKVDPHHPIVKVYTSNKSSPRLHEVLEAAVDVNIDRIFSETQSGSKRDQVRVRGDNDSDGKRAAFHWEAQLRGYDAPEATEDQANVSTEANTNNQKAAHKREYSLDLSQNGSLASRQPLNAVVRYSPLEHPDIAVSPRRAETGDEAGMEQPLQDPKATAEFLLRNPDTDPSRAKVLITVLLKQHLDAAMSKSQRDQLPAVTKPEPQDRPPYAIVDYSRSTISRLLANGVSDRKVAPHALKGPASQWNARKVGAGILGCAMLAVGAIYALDEVDDSYNRQLRDARAQIVREYVMKYDLDPEKIDFNDPTVKEHIREYAESHTLSPVSRVWEGIIGAQRTVNEFIDFDLNFGPGSPGDNSSPPPDITASASQYHGVSDVVYDGPPKTEWQLQSKGMSTDGFWAAGTSHVLQVGGGDGMAWNIDQQLAHYSVVEPRVLPTSYNGEQFIKASRHMNPSDMPEIDGHHLARIPVLEGTEVVAATLGGKPVRMLGMADGTTALQAEDGISNSGDLAYWIAPANDARKPHALRLISLVAPGPQTSGDFAAAPFVWEEKIPGFTTKNPEEQRNLMMNYIRDTFYYSLAPQEGKGMAFNSPARYTKDILANKRANCNIATTTFIIGTVSPSHPYQPESIAEAAVMDSDVVNPVVGYSNDGDQALTDYEAHMRAVDSDGDVYDPTPVKEEPRQKMPPDSPSPSSDFPLKTLGVALGVAAVGVLARRPLYTLWRKVAAMPDTIVKKRIIKLQKQLYADSEALHRSVDVLEAIRYDDEHDLSRAARRNGTFVTDRSSEAGMERLRSLYYYDAEGIALKQLALSRAERRALDPQTRQVVRRAGNIIAKSRTLFSYLKQDQIQ